MQPYLANVTFITIPDMTAPQAYDSAAQDCTYIIHVASPIPMKQNTQQATASGKSWKEVYYDPAVEGTLNILKAASHSGTVKRVVITSSGAVLASLSNPTAGATEIRSCPTMEQAEAVTDAYQAYNMSKILAISAANEYMKEARRGFGIVHVCPGYVQGSHELCENLDDLMRTTSRATVDVAKGVKLGAPPAAPHVSCAIWVEDVARAHVVALGSGKVKDGDVLVLVGNDGKGWEWSEVGRHMRELFPKEVEGGVLKPLVEQESMKLNFDSRSTAEKLGWDFAGPEVWAREVVAQYLQQERK